nr:Rv3654c family TadE-like protein [Actinoplanes durhamensis]
MRAGPGRDDRDRGAATIFVLAVGLVFVAAGLAGASIGAARVGRHQARVAADLGALAGASEAVYGQPTACTRAERFVNANGGEMTLCAVDGLDVTVRAQVEVRPMPGLTRQAEADARAGPVYIPVG